MLSGVVEMCSLRVVMLDYCYFRYVGEFMQMSASILPAENICGSGGKSGKNKAFCE